VRREQPCHRAREVVVFRMALPGDECLSIDEEGGAVSAR
jgi:hypothetical protein